MPHRFRSAARTVLRSSPVFSLLGAVFLLVLACDGPGAESGAESVGTRTAGTAVADSIGPHLFTHHYVSRDLPLDRTWGYGLVPPADFDGDGDPDFGILVRGDSAYWFENRVDAGSSNPEGRWERHAIGALAKRDLGGEVIDVDGDGATDLVLGGYWYRNPGDPTASTFERYRFDDRLEEEIHDVVAADVAGDSRKELVLLGDGDGCFWYRIPEDPARSENWPRTTITRAVLDGRDDIHSGPFPEGIGDLDGDGDADLVMPDRWYENRDDGSEWVAHDLPFGSRGPWGLSVRSWIEDLNGDGDPDIVMVDSDQTASTAAWLESDGGSPPTFTAHELPTSAPGTRGSFHSLHVADFDGDGDPDVFTVEQEDTQIAPEGAPPRWYIWENLGGNPPRFRERVIFDGRLGGHDAIAADVDGDGDLDILSKIWNRWPENANGGREHVDWLENTLR